MSDLQTFDKDVRFELFRQFVERCRPPLASEIAIELGVRPVEVETAMRRLHDGHVIVLAPGSTDLWMAHPLSAIPTPYRAEVGDKSLYGNCIWDAFGIVGMLGGTGRVHGTCGDCGEALMLDVTDGNVESSDYVVHYAVGAAHWWDDIGFS